MTIREAIQAAQEQCDVRSSSSGYNNEFTLAVSRLIEFAEFAIDVLPEETIDEFLDNSKTAIAICEKCQSPIYPWDNQCWECSED